MNRINESKFNVIFVKENYYYKSIEKCQAVSQWLFLPHLNHF